MKTNLTILLLLSGQILAQAGDCQVTTSITTNLAAKACQQADVQAIQAKYGPTNVHNKGVVPTGVSPDGVYLRSCNSRMLYSPVVPGSRLEVAADRDGLMRESYECVIPSPAEVQIVSNL